MLFALHDRVRFLEHQRARNTSARRDHFSEPRSALDALRSILNEPRACYGCHKVARQFVVCSVPYEAPKNDDMAGLVRVLSRCDDELPTYGARTASYRLPSLPTRLHRPWGGGPGNVGDDVGPV